MNTRHVNFPPICQSYTSFTFADLQLLGMLARIPQVYHGTAGQTDLARSCWEARLRGGRMNGRDPQRERTNMDKPTQEELNRSKWCINDENDFSSTDLSQLAWVAQASEMYLCEDRKTLESFIGLNPPRTSTCKWSYMKCQCQSFSTPSSTKPETSWHIHNRISALGFPRYVWGFLVSAPGGDLNQKLIRNAPWSL